MESFCINVSDPRTVNKEGIFVRGAAYHRNSLLHGPEIANFFKNVSSLEHFEELLKQLIGFFSVIIEKESKLFMAVDHIRSFPLFYARWDSVILVSDDAEYIRQKIGITEMDHVSRVEFLLTGYNTGTRQFIQRD